MKIVLIGNPNNGKTTLFNTLTGLKQRVGNFPGVTVEKVVGRFQFTNTKGENEKVELIDLPGTYSLFPKSEDERVSFNTLCDPSDPNHPDVNIVVVDSTNLQRGLYLATQVIELGLPTLVALNMEDIAMNYGFSFNLDLLQNRLGCEVVMINARKSSSSLRIHEALSKGIKVGSRSFLSFDSKTQQALKKVRSVLPTHTDYGAFQLLTNYKQIGSISSNPEKVTILEEIREEYDFRSFTQQASESEERFKSIDQILVDVVGKIRTKKEERTAKIDNFITHPIYGYLLFFGIMFLMFQSLFSWAEKPMELIEWGFEVGISFLQSSLPAGWGTELLTNGVLAGLSGIAVFIPQIAFLFFFIGLLEETGYMARASFILDNFLRKFGLNGRSIIPLIGGFACAIPAIMATRSIANRKERLLTILITPLMSCSARLPVYTLLIALVIPDDLSFGPFNIKGITLFGLYILSTASALFLSWFLNRRIKEKSIGHFIMEMPDFKRPDWKNLGLGILQKVKIFLFDAGKIIVAISIVLWVLSSYGPSKRMEAIESKYTNAEMVDSVVSAQYEAEKLESSYAGIFGKAIEPMIAPLGYDWKIGIAIITSFAAREVFVGTMATIYSVSNPNDPSSIRTKMSQEINPATGKKRYDLPFGLSLMIFYVYALQCMSTLAVVRRETGGWKWPAIQFVGMGVMAYVSALAVYKIAELLLN